MLIKQTFSAAVPRVSSLQLQAVSLAVQPTPASQPNPVVCSAPHQVHPRVGSLSHNRREVCLDRPWRNLSSSSRRVGCLARLPPPSRSRAADSSAAWEPNHSSSSNNNSHNSNSNKEVAFLARPQQERARLSHSNNRQGAYSAASLLRRPAAVCSTSLNLRAGSCA